MTIEQLLSPAVMEWSKANRHLSKEQSIEEFNKWFADNIDLINESVKDNIDEINESLEIGMTRAKLLLESNDDFNFDNIDWDNANWSSLNSTDSTKDVEDENLDSEETETEKDTVDKTVSGKIILTDSLVNSKTNVFACVNAYLDQIEKKGLKNEPLSHIWGNLDVRKVTNMTALFAFADIPNADLSGWDVSKVLRMEGMFYKSSFNNDSICGWNVGNCESFLRMFTFSDFNQKINHWKLKEIEEEVVDDSGKPVMVNGKIKTKKTTVKPPLVGENADEEAAFIKKFWTDQFNIFNDQYTQQKLNLKESKKYNNMKHIVDFETFVNEGFGDFIKKGIDNIKSIFRNLSIKIDNFVAMFNKSGEFIPATSPYTSLNFISDGMVNGVNAFTNVKNGYLNNNVKSKASIVESPEYYGIVDKDSIEYQNYLTMVEMVNEHYAKYGDKLNEAFVEPDAPRVGFASDGSGLIDMTDISSEDLIEELETIMYNTPSDAGEDYSGPILIWGAPGIGKSSIPKSVIKAWNNKNILKKTLMVVECGDLTVDGFSIPLPDKKTIGDYLRERPIAANLIKNDIGQLEDEIEKIEVKVSVDAIKTWLPVYEVSSNEQLNDARNYVANGGVISDYVKNEKTGKFKEKFSETTEGGILLFDEFFRSNPQIFKILMQILLNRSFNNGKYKLGDKWAIMACSNRPGDDSEVFKSFKTTGAVVGTRFSKQFNFIPDFDDWKKWAVKHGFDKHTLEFLTQKKDPVTGEYTNWHTIRPDEYEKGKTGWPTPRTWSQLMKELRNAMRVKNCSSILELPERTLRREACGAIGEKLGKEYVQYLMYCKNNSFDTSEIFNNPNFEIPGNLDLPTLVGQVRDEFNASFSASEPPTDEQLTNMINTLGKVFVIGENDNLIKPFFESMFKLLGFFKDARYFVTEKYPNFTKAFMHRYKITAQELIDKLRK